MSAQGGLCAALVDEWVRHGVAHAVVAPGSRSTPMALALAARAELALHVVLDERSAAFVALGIGRATRTPAVLLCTSGTAAVGFHAAVVEAGLAGVPLLVCTADRPLDLHGIGAPQAIDQVGLYGASPVWAADVDPLGWPTTAWRSLGSRAAIEARRGPVHLNLRLREPLLDDGADGAPPPRPGGRPWHERPEDASVAGADAWGSDLGAGQRVLVVAGEGCDPRTGDPRTGDPRTGDPRTGDQRTGDPRTGDPRTGDSRAGREASAGPWPVLADPLSGWRVPGPATVAAFDAIARHAATDGALAPDLVLHLGRPPASKALAQWLDRVDARHVLVEPGGRWLDPSRRVDVAVADRPDRVLRSLQAALPASDPGWRAAWQGAETAAQATIAAVLADHPEVTEPGMARALVRHLPDGGALVVSSSMPVRDVEWFAEPRLGLEIHSNRGAKGIDGVTSTALGVALARAGRPTAALLGDLAFLHDGSGLNGLADRPCSLTLVVIDNHGGGIFSFLPQAAALAPDRFEQLFGTPQSVDLQELAGAHGIPSEEVEAAADLAPMLADATARGGVRLLLARTDRRRNVALHTDLADAVGHALGRR